MFRPLSVLASRIPGTLFWTVEPNLMAEPFLNKEKREQIQKYLQKMQLSVVSTIPSPYKFPTLSKKIE
jgi:hypothetical protein